MDRRTILGVLLISVVLVLTLLWSGNNQKKNAEKTSKYEQSIESQNAKSEDSEQFAQETANDMTAYLQDSLSPLFPAMNGTQTTTVLDNGLVKIGISSKGAAPYSAQLSGYKNQQGEDVILFSQDEISLNFKIDGKNLPAIQIANSDDVKVGEWVLAVGNPLGLNNTVTAGIVSAKARSMQEPGKVTSMIQTDAAINQGNSGGALVNTSGALIGINAMIYSQTGSNIGYGFAIPTSIMNKVVDDIKKYGTVQRAMIGIQGGDVSDYVDSEKEKGNEVDLGTMEGIYIGKVVEGSAAEDAGLKEGDVITHIDGQKVPKFGDLTGIIAQKRPGDKITINYLRNKQKKTATLTLKNEKGNTKVVKDADIDVLGGQFKSISDSQKEQLNIGYGLQVMKVNGGKLKDAGVPQGFIIQRVNEQSVKTIEDLQKIVKNASKSKPVLWIEGVYPTGKKGYFTVPLEDE